jgi:AraC-like DNA-binding protein
MGVTQGVLVNLLFFMPCVWLLCLSLLNLQRQGHVRRREWLIGLISYPLVAVALLGVNRLNGHQVLDDTAALRNTEMAVAVVFSLMQIYYSLQLFQGFMRLTRALNDYYDKETEDVVRWMRNSVMQLTLIGLFAPLAIFLTGPLLLVYSVGMMYSISYTVINFYSYGIDHRRQQTVEDAENSNDHEDSEETKANHEKTVREEDRQRVGQAVERWLSRKGHLHSGITIQTAADDMRIPRYQLKLWLKTTEQKLFNPWLTNLRIEEAKRQLKKHPEWSNDTIAEHCGFSSRNYFQTIFKKQTGVSPSEFS